MRKIILSACLLFSTIIACAQLTSSSAIPYTNLMGIDYVFIFNGITSSTEITYTGTYTTINWYKFSDSTTSISNQNSISPEDGTGYTLIVDGIPTHIWVIDYKNYLPVLQSIEPENKPELQCKDVNLIINATVPVLSYTTFDNVNHILPRNFDINYQTLTWDKSNGGWIPTPAPTIQSIVLPASQNSVSVPVPYMNTVFTLSGDQYATKLGIPLSILSATYTTNAVISHLATVVTSRDQGTLKNNEGEFPNNTTTPISFSAPIDVQFLSNANEPTTQFYNWGIYKEGKLIVTRSDKDQRYTFTDFGNYEVKLTVSNAICSFTDSLAVTVSESALFVPNVFTPNGDLLNDEFKVAYKSLTTFQCWVYNRWGRQVYYWNDPMKGWDGNINGKKASVGPYFYVIKAVGADKKVYKLKGDINLLR